MKKTDSKTVRLTIGALFAAIIIVMDIIPQVGFFSYGGVSITFLIIPVAVGAYLLGAGWGAFLGLLFGIASFLRCFAIPYPDVFGALIWTFNNIGCVALCLIPRTLMGFLCGVIGDVSRKKNSTDDGGIKNAVPMIACSFAGALFNTIFFVSMFILIYRNADLTPLLGEGGVLSERTVKDIILIFVTVNAVIEFFVCGIIGTVLCKALTKVLKRAKIYE